MILTDLNRKRNKVVGTKQTLKAVNNGEIKKLYLATDIDEDLKEKILSTASSYNIPLEIVDSKLKLGRACGIDIAAACAGILKESEGGVC